MRTVIPLSVGLLLLVASGLRFRLHERPWFLVLASPLWAAATVVAAGLTVLSVVHAPFFDWNAPRLAVSAGLFAGFGIYAPIEHGLLLGHNYGPVSPVVYLPAMLMPTPGTALGAASLLAFLVVVLPIVLVLHLEGAERRRLAWLACLTVWLVVLAESVTRFTLFSIHADAPAIGLTIVACAAVYRESHRVSRGWMAVSALAAVLAVGSKQVAVPLLVVLPLWIWAVDGRAAMRRYLWVAVQVGLLALVVVLLLVDFGAMFFNAVLVIGTQGFKSGGWRSLLLRATRDLAPRLFPYLIAAVSAVAIDRGGSDIRTEPRAWLRSHPWALFTVLSLASIPSAIVGRSIVGGSTNGLAYPIVFAMVGAALSFLSLARRTISPLRVAAVPAVAWAFTIVSAGLAMVQVPMLQRLPDAVRSFRANPDDAMLGFWREHPGEVYLPFNPLIGLMADGSAYHFSWGLYSRQLAGYTPSVDRFWAHVPPRLKYVALYKKNLESDPTWMYLSDFTSPIAVDSLPGWRVLTRPDGGVGRSREALGASHGSPRARAVARSSRRSRGGRKRASRSAEVREQLYPAVVPLTGRLRASELPASYCLT